METKKGLPELPTGYVWRSGNIVEVGKGVVDTFPTVRWGNGRVIEIAGRLWYISQASRHGVSQGYSRREITPAEAEEVFAVAEKAAAKTAPKSLSREEIERREYEDEVDF